ncbi:MAG: polysaccharide pyruvyl transferase family protein [Methylovulum sp.]|nr:polysaccharide pyruvyl transferase family protein [Methylovulum sp.]MCF8007153.1 polysaccharide pyruvyl transferase family protein [Methylovulum sp.]
MDKININDYLKQYLSDDVIYVPNPGNAGDSLIAHATYQVLDRLGINYQEGNLESIYENKIVFYGGGGNLVNPYTNALTFIENNYSKVKKLVILPHTIRDYSNILSTLGKNVDLICREKESYKYVTQHATRANIFVSDDLAFHTNVKKTIDDGDAMFTSVDQFFIRNIKRNIRSSMYNTKNVLTNNILNSFRTDIEKTDIIIPFNNIDISQAFATDNMSKLYSHEAVYRIFKFIEKFNCVNTNRLHICIASALLGKEVNFYRNSYNKNYSIYEFSLHKKYNNVVFIDN